MNTQVASARMNHTNESNKALIIFIVGFFLNFGSTLLWSGLPIFLTSKFYDVYLYASLATVFNSLFGIKIIQKFGTRLSFIVSLILVSALLILSLFEKNIIFTVFFIFLSFGLLQIIEMNWIQEITKVNHPFLTRRFQWVAAAKLIGMGMGPLLFSYLPFPTFTALSILFLAGLCLPQFQPELFHFETKKNENFTFKDFFKNIFPSSIILAILCGILSVSFNPFALNLLKNHEVTSVWFSFYWFGTGIAYILAGSLFHKLNEIKNINYFITFVQICIIFVVFTSKQPLSLILAASIYTLLNPYFYLKFSYKAASTQATSPYALATFNLWVDLGILLGLCVQGFLPPYAISAVFVIALVARTEFLGTLFAKVRKRSHASSSVST